MTEQDYAARVRLLDVAHRAYDRWTHYFDADNRADYWNGLCLAMDELGAALHPERALALAAPAPSEPCDDLRAALAEYGITTAGDVRAALGRGGIYNGLAPAPSEPDGHSCDWPGCSGQCHTGPTCPCHPAPSEPVREAVFDALTALRSLASDATSAADALSLAINRHRAALAAPAPSEPRLREAAQAVVDEWYENEWQGTRMSPLMDDLIDALRGGQE